MSVKLTDNSSKVIAEKDKAISRALEKIGMTAESYAVLRCPVRTGRLSNSLTHEVRPPMAIIGTNVEYGKYVEFGTGRQRAQPYLAPAVKNHLPQYKQIVKTELQK